MTGLPIGEDDLQAYVDGRLPEARRRAVEAYLADHADARERIAADHRHLAALRSSLAPKFAEPVPARLRIANLQMKRRARWKRRASMAAAGLLIFVAGASGGWIAGGQSSSGPPGASVQATAAIAEGAAAAYRTFVVEVVHPVEVGAAQEAHLLQWLSKRLGRPLAAPDLGRFGYHLMGGRLLPAGSGAAAQLMYDDASGRRLTIYLRAASGTETAFRFHQEADASTFFWIDQGFGFAVTAVATRSELLPIAEVVYQTFAGKT